jgi:8-oxo-dGTP pyrophosphatase MutT (NUDIX family)
MQIVHRDTVAAYIVSSDNKVLFGRKDPSKGGVYVGCWHVPGGGIDAGETSEQALVREVHEETGIDITNAYITLVDDSGRGESVKHRPGHPDVLVKMTFAVYRVAVPMQSSEIQLVADDDLIEMAWFSLEELQKLQLTPPARAYFAEHGADWLIKQQ